MTEPSDRPGSRIVLNSDPPVVYELKAVLRLGRSSRSDVVIDSKRASRHHAEIRALSSGKFCVWDSGSRNGTFVNGLRITGSRVLRDGDEINIAGKTFAFEHVGEQAGETTMVSAVPESEVPATDVGLDERAAITLVSDIRRYTTLSEKYGREFQTFVAEWFRDVVGLVQRRNGIVDKIHGDGLLVYWWLEEGDPGEVIGKVLHTCDGIMHLRDRFAGRLEEELEGEIFDVGVAVHMGGVLLGNLGTGSVHAFTAVGDAVNVTFRLEGLTKSIGQPVLISNDVARRAPPCFTLVDRGAVTIRGWSGKLGVWSLENYQSRPMQDDDEDDVAATEQATDAAAGSGRSKRSAGH
ncbi:MAG: adenylate/guanylate cyclase domain-containing protein [Myxococcales bacterium]|nr:adenylate/guanylate cyclase domain-containing protein [Myxococcales bacterium]